MPVRFEINAGRLQVIQSFDFPAVYLDHWAIRRLSSDATLGARFLNSLKRSRGSLVVSHANFAEIAGPADPRHADEIATFLEAALPNIYFAMFDSQKAIDQEKVSRDTTIRLKAPPDIELLLEVARQRPDDFRSFSIAGVIKAITARRDQLNAVWTESNRELANLINTVRFNAETMKQAQNFQGHPRHVPTLAVMQELLRPIFLDQAMAISQNDAGDIRHAITSISYCDYTLLDRRWEDFYERMVRRFSQLGLHIRVAKVFSDRGQGLELFLKEFENHGVESPA